MDQNNTKLSFLSIVALISFIVGGLAGGLVSVFGSDYISTLFNYELNKEPIERIININEDSAVVDVVEQTGPAVVSIVVSKDLSQYYNTTGSNIFPFDNFFQFGFPNDYQYTAPTEEGENKQKIGGGTGFIISDNGMILTNKHVVIDTQADYTVITSDGTEYPAKILDSDPINDIAIMKIDATNLPTVELGDSDNLKIGQSVIAIGYSLGEYANTVTTGVVSGVGRTVYTGTLSGQSETIEQAIQTDAAINPGNSGGPLLNLAGQVIGINTAINQAGQLIGFAIPINNAKKDIESVKEHGKIVRPWLGIRYIIINEKVAKVNNLEKDYGALIVRGQTAEELAVVPGSPADKSGLTENDIILEFNGVQITEERDLAKQIMKYSPGDEVEAKVYSKGEEKTVKIILTEYPEE